MKKFSLLVPTRERIKLAAGFMNSVFRNTTNKEDIEVLFVCDDDDTGSQNYVEQFKKTYGSIDIKLYTRPRTEFINADYYNWLADKAEGELFWVLADDLELVQPNWDVTVYQNYLTYINDKIDKVVCLSIKDNTPVPSHTMPKFPCFPMFTREAKDFFGWILHPTTPNWGADYICYMIFKPCGRLLEIHDTNYINHISWHTKQVKPDHINQRIGNIFNKLKMIPKYNTDRALSEEVPQLRKKLESYINDFRVNKERKII